MGTRRREAAKKKDGKRMRKKRDACVRGDTGEAAKHGGELLSAYGTMVRRLIF